MSAYGAVELPLCPICCEWLGKYGGPVTLPCGHNGCLDCFSHVRSYNPECPLCRKSFDPQLKLSCNHELRDLIALKKRDVMDDEDAAQGWEAFPGPKLANEHYALTMQAEQQQQRQQQHQQQQQQQQQPLSFQSCYGSPTQRPYPNVPPPATAPPAAGYGSNGGSSGSNGSNGGGWGGVNPGVIAGAALMQEGGQGAGLGALVNSSSSSRVGCQQYHAAYHQHPGLPLSAPSGTQTDILHWEPPQWLPDSYAQSCFGCHQPFKPLFTSALKPMGRLRHHCRLCGKVFCDACSSQRKMMPPRFRQRDPQRVCELCAQLLDPLQPFLVGTAAACAQPPVHDALDPVSLRSWLNSPWGVCMADEVYKAANIVATFSQAVRPELERQVPISLLRGVRGLALLSVMRVGAGWSCTAGTGVVVARQRNGTWSAPCAISCYGLGWGVSLGGALTDVLLVLRTEEAVKAFASGTSLGLGTSANLALGPVGRSAEASLRMGGLAAKGAVVGYSCSRGAYAGVGLEGTVTSCRGAVNRAFYGCEVTPRQLLVDCSVPQPPAAVLLYEKLEGLTALLENRGSLVQSEAVAAAAAVPVAVAQACRPLAVAAAAAADCKAVGKQQQQQQEGAAAVGGGVGVVSSSNESSSSSREWDMVGSFAAADALEQFEEPHPQYSQTLPQQQQQQQQRGGVFEVPGMGGESDGEDSIEDFLASAPPAPTHLLHDYHASASQQQQQQQVGHGEQQQEEEEEMMYALEW